MVLTSLPVKPTLFNYCIMKMSVAQKEQGLLNCNFFLFIFRQKENSNGIITSCPVGYCPFKGTWPFFSKEKLFVCVSAYVQTKETLDFWTSSPLVLCRDTAALQMTWSWSRRERANWLPSPPCHSEFTGVALMLCLCPSVTLMSILAKDCMYYE